MVGFSAPTARTSSPQGIAEVVGDQLAWWQLGFRIRCAVLRHARVGQAHPDPEISAIARRWAAQVIAAPWWWRLAKAGAASAIVAQVIAVIIQAGPGSQDWAALSAAILAAAPLAVAWVWRNGRQARAIAALDGDSPDMSGSTPRWRRSIRLVGAVLCTTLAIGGTVYFVQQELTIRYGCPAYRLDPDIRRWWISSGGRRDVGCPSTDTQTGPDGQRYTRFSSGDTVYAVPGLGVIRVSGGIAAAWAATGGGSGPLGHPVDHERRDGLERYLNLSHGYISQRPGQPPRVVAGSRYLPSNTPDGRCEHPDRPCLLTGRQVGERIRIGWTYGAADAFNVGWWRVGESDGHAVEVAGYEFELPAGPPGVLHGFAVQACDKRFLRPSKCTPWSDTVVVRTV